MHMLARVLRFVRLPMLLVVLYSIARFCLSVSGFPYAPRGNAVFSVVGTGVVLTIVYGALSQIETKAGKNALEVFSQALSNVKPMVEVKSRRVGGANYQVPVEVRPVRRMALAMRWLREAAKKRSEKSMPLRLAGELMEAAEGRGGAMKKREEVHRMAEANKAFAHFRF